MVTPMQNSITGMKMIRKMAQRGSARFESSSLRLGSLCGLLKASGLVPGRTVLYVSGS